MLPDNLSRFSIGTAAYGTGLSKETSFSILDAYMEAGGNFIDTAAVYGFGESEKVIGEWMKKKSSRGNVFVATKGAHPSLPDWKRRLSEVDIRSDIEASLSFLQTDYIDLYFLHRDDLSLPVEEIMPVLDKLVKEGKTRFIGASNWSAERINDANEFAEKNGLAQFSASQILWNGAVINKDGMDKIDPKRAIMDEKEHFLYAENKIPVMAYTSQAKGLFDHIKNKGYDNLSEYYKVVYVNDGTKRRAEKIFAVSERTG
ncbi:MAG: aldo/keto reductase, partial [Clostridia bacterium]|nr:aldo/keto reductase [Clostridia bacterium]